MTVETDRTFKAILIQNDRPIHVHSGEMNSHELEAALLFGLKELALHPVHVPVEQQVSRPILTAFELSQKRIVELKGTVHGQAPIAPSIMNYGRGAAVG